MVDKVQPCDEFSDPCRRDLSSLSTFVDVCLLRHRNLEFSCTRHSRYPKTSLSKADIIAAIQDVPQIVGIARPRPPNASVHHCVCTSCCSHTL